MRSVDEHRALALSSVSALPAVEVDVLEAGGCVLAEDIAARWPLPSFDNSSMDGYAVIAADLARASGAAPVTLSVRDDVPAGHLASAILIPGTAIRIMTGATIPEGADAVVPVEWTDAGTAMVAIDRPVDVGAHVRRRGEDVAAGEIVLRAGTPLNARTIAILVAVGRGRVMVHRRPRVAVVSTGTELVDPGTELAPGLIADSNGIMLVTAVREAGAEAIRVGPVADDEDLLLDILLEQADQADLVVTTGGVSMGAYDTVKAVLSRVGTVEFVKVAMQPGMPQGLGRLTGRSGGEVPIVTLPGNPVSAFVSFELFVRPLIRRLLGFDAVDRPRVSATCTESFVSPAGKTQFARAVLTQGHSGSTVRPMGAQGSHILGGLSQANALAIVPSDIREVSEGDQLTVIDLSREAVDAS